MEGVSYGMSKVLPSSGCNISIAERKKCCAEEIEEARAQNNTGIFQELGIFLPSMTMSWIRQFCQCDEMLMKFCFPRGVSALSLWTTFPSFLVSRTTASNCTIFSCGAVTNNAKLSLVSFIYSSVHSMLCLSHTFNVEWVNWSDVKRTRSRQCLYKLNLFMSK